MKYLIVIQSQLQAINAYEFIKNKNIIEINYDILLISNENKHTNKNIKNLLNYLFKKKYFIEEIDLSNLISIFKFKNNIKHYKIRFNKYNNIIFGNLTSLKIRYFINCLKKNNILIDDGTETINYDYLKNNNLQVNENTQFLSKTKYIIAKFFFNLDYNVPKVDYFFTYFYKIKNHKIIYNNLANFKKSFYKNDFINSTQSFFIGQPLYINGPISYENYKKLILELNNKFDKKDFVYILHRHESNNMINFLKSNNIKYKLLNECFEFYLIIHRIKPKNILSISSTALITCNLIVDKKITKISKIYLKNTDFKRYPDFLNIDNCINKYIDEKNSIYL